MPAVLKLFLIIAMGISSSGDDGESGNAQFNMRAMVSFLPNKPKACGQEYFFENRPVYRCNSWHLRSDRDNGRASFNGYPGHYLGRRVSTAGTFRFQARPICIRETRLQEDIAVAETADGIWSIYFDDVLLARLDARTFKRDASTRGIEVAGLNCHRCSRLLHSKRAFAVYLKQPQ